MLTDPGAWFRQFLSCMNIDPDLVVAAGWTSLASSLCLIVLINIVLRKISIIWS